MLQQKPCGQATHDSSGGGSNSRSLTGISMQIFATAPQLRMVCMWSEIGRDHRHNQQHQLATAAAKTSSWRVTACFD